MRKGMTLARAMAIAVLGVALGLGAVGESVAQGGMKKDETKTGDAMKSSDAMKKAGDGMKDDMKQGDMKQGEMKQGDMKKDGKSPMQGDRTMEKKQ